MGPFISTGESRDEMNATICRVHNNLNCYHGNVLQSNNDSTKNSTKLTSALLRRQRNKVSLALCLALLK